MRVDTRGELLDGEGLYDIVVPAGGKAVELVALLDARGEEDYRAGDVLAYAAADLEPVEVRHVHVKQYEVRCAAGLTNGLFAAGRAHYLVAA